MSGWSKQNRFFATYSRIVLIGYLLSGLVFAIWVWGFNAGRIAPYLYLLAVGRVAIGAVLTSVRAKSDSGASATGWWFVTAGLVFAGVATIARYPNNTEPADSLSVAVLSVIGCAVLALIVWDRIPEVSRVRVIGDSIWLAVATTAALWFVVIVPIAASSQVQLLDSAAIFVQIASLSLATALLVNLWAKDRERSVLSPAILHFGFVYLALLAILDTLRAFDLIGFDRHIEFLAFFADFALVFASQIKSENRQSSVVRSAKGAHVAAITSVPLIVAVIVLAVTAPPQYRIPVVLGAIVSAVLAARVFIIGAENNQLESELVKMATTDELTVLPNRRALELDFEQIDSNKGAAIYIDLDYFKQVNDTFGHEAGDQVLTAFSERLLNAVRSTDRCYRIGGDEFVVLAGYFDDDPSSRQDSDIEGLVERIRNICDEPFVLPVGTARVGLTIGVATAGEAMGLVTNADRAMTNKKQEGRGLVGYYSESVSSEAVSAPKI